MIISSSFLAVIASIALLEILLSVDNALVNASLAQELPEHEQKKAIYYGIGMGAIFRILALFAASFLIQSVFIKTLGALYLCYLAYAHFARSSKEKSELKKHPHFKRVILEIALADIVFSIDNVVGAVGISTNFKAVIFGVIVGIISMLFITQIMSVLIHKFPTLEKTAYLIVAFIGLSMLSEMYAHFAVDEIHKFFVILAMIAATVAYDLGRAKKSAR